MNKGEGDHTSDAYGERPAHAPVLAALTVMAAFCAAVMLIPKLCGALCPGIAEEAVRPAVRIVFTALAVYVFRRRLPHLCPPGNRASARPASARLASVWIPCAVSGVLLQLALSSLTALILGAHSVGVRCAPTDLASLAAFLSASLVTPVCEETVFRALAYRTMRKAAGPAPSMLLTSLVFAVSHGSIPAVAAAFKCGIILAAFTERHGSVIGPVLCHAAFNITSFFAGYLPLSPAVCLAVTAPPAAACIIFTLRKGRNQ